MAPPNGDNPSEVALLRSMMQSLTKQVVALSSSQAGLAKRVDSVLEVTQSTKERLKDVHAIVDDPFFGSSKRAGKNLGASLARTVGAGRARGGSDGGALSSSAAAGPVTSKACSGSKSTKQGNGAGGGVSGSDGNSASSGGVNDARARGTKRTTVASSRSSTHAPTHTRALDDEAERALRARQVVAGVSRGTSERDERSGGGDGDRGRDDAEPGREYAPTSLSECSKPRALAHVPEPANPTPIATSVDEDMMNAILEDEGEDCDSEADLGGDNEGELPVRSPPAGHGRDDRGGCRWPSNKVSPETEKGDGRDGLSPNDSGTGQSSTTSRPSDRRAKANGEDDDPTVATRVAALLAPAKDTKGIAEAGSALRKSNWRSAVSRVQQRESERNGTKSEKSWFATIKAAFQKRKDPRQRWKKAVAIIKAINRMGRFRRASIDISPVRMAPGRSGSRQRKADNGICLSAIGEGEDGTLAAETPPGGPNLSKRASLFGEDMAAAAAAATAAAASAGGDDKGVGKQASGAPVVQRSRRGQQSAWNVLFDGTGGRTEGGRVNVWNLWSGWEESVSKLIIDGSFCVLHPDSTVLLVWATLVGCINLYNGVAVPLYNTHFDVGEGMNPLHGWDVTSDVLLFVDTLLNFNIGYKERGIAVANRRLIAKRYMRSWLAIDGATCLPIDLFMWVGGLPPRVFVRARLLKLLRMTRLAHLFQLLLEKSQINPRLLRIARMFLMLFFSIHWATCLVRTVIDFDPNAYDVMPICEDPEAFQAATGGGSPDVLAEDMLEEMPTDPIDCAASVWLGSPYHSKDEVLRYGYGFYWSFFTMLGERSSPHTQLQTLFTVVTTFVGLFVYVSLFGQLVALLEDSEGSSTANRQKMDLVSQCMRRYNMPAKLQSRIRSYYELHFMRQTRMVGSPAVLSLFEELPQYMRQGAI